MMLDIKWHEDQLKENMVAVAEKVDIANDRRIRLSIIEHDLVLLGNGL